MIDRPDDDFLKSRAVAIDKFNLAIEVRNPSSKAISITHVGFARRLARGRCLINKPTEIVDVSSKGPIFGRRLEPLTNFVVYTCYTPHMIFNKYGRFTFALVETESGRLFRGSSRILRHIQKALKTATARRLEQL